MVGGVLISGVISLLTPDRILLIFGGDVVTSDEYAITFDNLDIETNYYGLNPPKSKALDILSQWKTGETYSIDLGWYNTHVLTGEHYGVSAYYRAGQLEDVTVTRRFDTWP